jgi:type I restriction enzyme S subunit
MGSGFPPGTIPARGFDWERVVFLPRRVGEFADLRYGKSLVESKRTSGSVPVYGTNGRCGWHNEGLRPGPGVILGRKGQGPLGVEWCSSPFWVIDTAYFATVSEDVDLKWFYYIVKYVGLNHLKSGEKPGLQRDTFRAQLFPFPPKDVQTEIAHLLSALDSKIVSNRDVNTTLEALSTGLFESWFSNFDPVAAKRDGRIPVGVPGNAIDLFPSHFGDSELGPIPQGWRVVSLDSVADFLNGLALQRYPSRNGDVLPVIKIAELRAGNSVGADLCGGVPPEYIIDDGDVIFSWSGSLLVDVWCGGKGALNQHLFKVTSREVPKWFYLAWLNEHLPEFQAIAADKATTMGHIRRFHLTEAKVLLPPEPLMKAMTTVQQPLVDQIIHNRLESRSLAALRDTLLGPLLSGELTIKSAENSVGAPL